MPTITVADLQRLIQSASYEQYARGTRGRSREVARPQSGNPYRRPRSRSRSKSRSRSLSRPRSAPRSRTAITFNENINVSDQLKRSKRVRPQSAKSTLSLNSYKESELDFTGVTNMMSGLKLNQWRKWKSKTDINSKQNNKSNDDLTERQKESKPRKFVNAENKDLVKNKDSDPNALRKSRSSSYSKFRYPLQHHSSNVRNNNARLVMENNIPACLRRFPRYVNQPVRHKCTYNPPVRPVTKVKTHCIKSDSLPSPHTAVVASKPPLPPQSKAPAMINSQEGFNIEIEERERNGSYHYVYNGPPSKFDTGDEIRDDELPETARFSQIIPDTDGVISVDENLGEVEAHVTEIIPDNKSDNTDDMFQDDDYNFDHVNGNFEEDEKKSYGDINDLHSIGEISEEENLVKKSPQTSFHKEVIGESSEDEIEEDIPEAFSYKPTSFTNNNRPSVRHIVK